MAKDRVVPAMARLDREVVGFGQLAGQVLAAPARCGDTRLVCVDGPSAAGKTALTERLAAALDGPAIVHMDDLYDGWDGLAEGVRRLTDLVAALAAGKPARYHRYDWERGAYGPEVDLGTPPVLLVEGVGAGAVADNACLLIWLETPETVRYRRGMTRDGEAYRPYWDRWAAQERAHYAAFDTPSRADVVVDGAAAVHHDPGTRRHGPRPGRLARRPGYGRAGRVRSLVSRTATASGRRATSTHPLPFVPLKLLVRHCARITSRPPTGRRRAASSITATSTSPGRTAGAPRAPQATASPPAGRADRPPSPSAPAASPQVRRREWQDRGVEGVRMRRARADEGPAVLGVLDSAARRLRAAGISGWPDAFRPEWIEPGLGEGKVWLAEVDDVPVATLSVYWSDVLWADDGRAGYLHRFATRDAGGGLGAALLRWTAEMVRARGRDRVRIDCAAENRALRGYYERAGFEHRGDLVLDHGAVRWSSHRPTVSRYERRA